MKYAQLKDIKIIHKTFNTRDSFFDIIKRLTRPYYPISKDTYNKIVEQDTDFVIYNDKLCTYGNADGGYALMPYSPKNAAESKRLLGR